MSDSTSVRSDKVCLVVGVRRGSRDGAELDVSPFKEKFEPRRGQIA